MNRREQEILTALFENPEGLTNAQTTAWCISKVGAELPNSPSISSKLIYDLRDKGYITSFSIGASKINKITELGKSFLAEELAIDKTEIIEIEAEAVIPDINNGLEQGGEYDSIYKLIKEHAALKASRTIDKLAEKSAILNQLISSPFIDETVTTYLQEIADDLQTIMTSS